MKHRSTIWIPPAQTTLRQLAELNRQASYLKGRSENIRSQRFKKDSQVFKKLVTYQSELSLIRNSFAHSVTFKIERSSGLDINSQPEPAEVVLRFRQIEDLLTTGIERLAVGDKPRLNERFQSLEGQLASRAFDFYQILAPTPDEIIKARSEILEAVQARINEHLYQIRREIGVRIFRLRVGLTIDRRAKFRSIVRFIFKNLDDYDIENDVLRTA